MLFSTNKVYMRWGAIGKGALVVAAALIAVAYAVGGKIDRDRADRDQVLLREEARRQRMYDVCKSAITRTVGESVVHWGAEGDWSIAGHGGRRVMSNSDKWFGNTSEGYSVSLNADTGARQIGYDCYLAKDERTIKKIIRR